MRVVRIITYAGRPEDIADQLSRSMPDGVKPVNSRITIGIQTLPSVFGVYQLVYNIWNLLRKTPKV